MLRPCAKGLSAETRLARAALAQRSAGGKAAAEASLRVGNAEHGARVASARKQGRAAYTSPGSPLSAPVLAARSAAAAR
jgi:hypothetical protein